MTTMFGGRGGEGAEGGDREPYKRLWLRGTGTDGENTREFTCATGTSAVLDTILI